MHAIAATAARMRSKSIPKPIASDSIPPPPTPRTLLVEKHGKLHHPFPRTLAPYPVNYEKTVLDADALDLAFRLQIFEGSPTSIPDIRLDSPKSHPRRCLDIGCSSGDWILAASRAWPNATFVGVDLIIGHQIPVHLLEQQQQQQQQPPLQSIDNMIPAAAAAAFSSFSPEEPKPRSDAGNPTTLNHPYAARPAAANANADSGLPPPSPSSPAALSLGSRIRWVQANVLKSLPFGDGEFDYIHISGIARGVPEDKWDALFAEVSRILAVNGHFEMFEEDVIFPILPSEPPAGAAATATSPPPHLPESGRNGSTGGFSETASISRTSVSSYMYFDTSASSASIPATLASDDKSRRASFSANRFLAAAAPKPPRPPVPPLRLNTKLSLQFHPGPEPSSGTGGTSTSRSTEFPFGGSPASASLQNQVAGPGVKAPKKRCADPAIPRGWDGPSTVKRCDDPAIPSGWEGPSQVKRCNDPAIPSGWDGPPERPTMTVTISPRKEDKALRRPRTASAVASSFISLSNKSASLSRNARRPSSAGSGSLPSRSKSKSRMDGTMPSPPPIPPMPSSFVDSMSSFSRHGRQASLVMPDAPPPMSSIKHDHHVLQTLFFGVYEGRFINTTPTAILPSLFNMYFQNVTVTPPIDFPAPPAPPAARENTRRDKRNTTQREWGSAGLEQSRGLTMNLSKSFVGMNGGDIVRGSTVSPTAQLVNNRYHADISSITVERHVKRVQSSPGLAMNALNRSSSRVSTPLSSNSNYTGRSESSLSRNTSYLTTPVSSQAVDPYIENPGEGIPQRHHQHVNSVVDGMLASPSAHQLHHCKSTTLSVERPATEEEEDAKFAIMGDGGCFPTEEDSKSSETKDTQTLSHFPSLASLRSDPGVARNEDEWQYQQEREEEVLVDPLQTLDIEDEEDDFDHLAAEELEIFDIIGRAEEPPSGSLWSNGYEEIRKRVFVRPRKAFAGIGKPVPSKLLELDDMSMGIHLTRAWLNVVACKEAMWDELQRRAQVIQSPTQESSSPYTEPYSPNAQRVTLLDEVEWIGTERNMSAREKFELLFLRFEDDMRQWAAVGSAIPRKLSWIDPRYPNLGPVPLLSSQRNGTSRSSGHGFATSLHGPVFDNNGPGRDGIIIPGVDICRTLRVFTGRKLQDRARGGNASKILGVL